MRLYLDCILVVAHGLLSMSANAQSVSLVFIISLMCLFTFLWVGFAVLRKADFSFERGLVPVSLQVPETLSKSSICTHAPRKP